MTNLATNVFRYGQAPVRVSALRHEGHVHVLVEDSGPGVAYELEGTLFERFTRAASATASQAPASVSRLLDR